MRVLFLARSAQSKIFLLLGEFFEEKAKVVGITALYSHAASS